MDRGTQMTKASVEENRKRRGKGPRRHACQLLKDMRAVYKQDSQQDATPGQRVLRMILNKDPEKFIGRLAMLEKAHRAGSGPKSTAAVPGGTSGPAPEKDEGTERVRELIARLLKELKPGG